MDDNEWLERLGQRIRQIREKRNMTQEELALRIGKTQKAISGYENGSRAIRLTELPELAQALQVPMAYLMGDEPKTEQEYYDHKALLERGQMILASLSETALKDAVRELELLFRYQIEEDRANENMRGPRRPKRLSAYSKKWAMTRHKLIAERDSVRIAYEIYMDAHAAYTRTDPLGIRNRISQLEFLNRIDRLYVRYIDGEFSLETFASIMMVDVPPLRDILEWLEYIKNDKDDQPPE